MYSGEVEITNTVSSKGGDSAGETVYAKNEYSVIEIACNNGSVSSGFIIDNQGHAITCTHCVVDKLGNIINGISARVKGGEYSPVKVLATFRQKLEVNERGKKDDINDVALIKFVTTPRNAKPSTFGDSDKIKNGSTCFAIGNSAGHGTCITAGIVSDKCRESAIAHGCIMIDAALNPGNSGGPIFNRDGEVIGIAQSVILSAKGMNYAVPINHAKKLVKRYM
jgi:putative serine protease PepD